jgi:hypothetical protein
MGILTTTDAIIGFYQFHPVARERSHIAWLNYIGVTKNSRYRGAGSQLLRYFEEHAQAAGFARIELDVLEENLTAQRFYKKHDYQCLELRQHSGRAKYRYVKNIVAAPVTVLAGTIKPVDSMPILTRVTRKILYRLLVDIPDALGFPGRHSG